MKYKGFMHNAWEASGLFMLVEEIVISFSDT